MDRMEFLHTGYSHSCSPTDQEVPFHGRQFHRQSVLFYCQHNIVLLEIQRFPLLSFPARFSALQALSDGLLSAFPRQVSVLSALYLYQWFLLLIYCLHDILFWIKCFCDMVYVISKFVLLTFYLYHMNGLCSFSN